MGVDPDRTGSTAGSRGARRDEALLGSLLSQVSRARAEVRAGRGDPARNGGHLEQARRTARLAEAMEAYADAAATAGIPLPYRYRDELRLYRSMAADERGTRLN
jgi:hypothetical protein